MNEPWEHRRLTLLEERVDRHREEMTSLKVLAGKTDAMMEMFCKRFDNQEATLQKQNLILDKLQATANRWYGIVIAALVLGPIIGAVTGILIRWVLFGHPISETPGLIK